MTTHRKSQTNIYHLFYNMKDRCYNKKSNNYKYYGGRGIRISKDWLNDFINFYNWSIKNGYKYGLTIDRIDVNKNYSPENCRWVTMLEQNVNKNKRIDNQSKYTGIHYDKNRNKWMAFLSYNNKCLFRKRFNSLEDAINARNEFIVNNNLPHKNADHK